MYSVENLVSGLPLSLNASTGELTVHGDLSAGSYTLYVTASDQPQTATPRR